MLITMPSATKAESDRIVWVPQSLGDAFDNWNDAGRLRPVGSAVTSRVPLGKGGSLVTIEHETIRGVTAEMLEWWFTHFPYYAVALPSGEIVSAYRLWHPVDHRSVKVRRHSLSGQLGMAIGARLDLRSAWSGLPRRTSLRIRRMDRNGLAMNIVAGPQTIGAIEEVFQVRDEGIHCTTALTLCPRKPILFRPFRSRRFSSGIVTAWVKHKIEEVGNLERVLPPLYYLAGAGGSPHSAVSLVPRNKAVNQVLKNCPTSTN